MKEKLLKTLIIGVLSLSSCNHQNNQPFQTKTISQLKNNISISGRNYNSLIRAQQPTWEDIKNQNYNSPRNLEEIATLLRSYTYVPDEIRWPVGEIYGKNNDYWWPAKETLTERAGDCEDFAILGAYISSNLGYIPKMIIIYNNEEGHALTLLEKNTPKGKKYGLIEQGRLIPPQYKSIDSLLKNAPILLDPLISDNEEKYILYNLYTFDKKDKRWQTSKENLAKTIKRPKDKVAWLGKLKDENK